jgi:hypothetical protein
MESEDDVRSESVEQAARDGVDRISRLRRTAVRIDSRPSLLAVARRLRHSLPGDEKFGDALSTAGRTPVEVLARGRIVKRLGDGVMATFRDAPAAVAAALDAQDALRDIDVGGYQPRMRAGVHWGRPRKLGGDYLGIDVNVAARVGDAAKGGQVLASDPVLERLGGMAVSLGRRKRLRADGAPRGLHVTPVSRG